MNVPTTTNGFAALLWPGGIVPVSNSPGVSDVAVWATPSTRFCQVTVSPGLIVAGANVKFWIATVRPAASAVTASESASATNRMTTRAAVLRPIR